MLLAGAAFVGGYLAFALFHLPRWDAPAPRARVVVGLVAMVVSLGLVAAGWALEYACRVPRRDDDDADTEP
jgi:xanthosine utilization system XapX-like protein